LLTPGRKCDLTILGRVGVAGRLFTAHQGRADQRVMVTWTGAR